MTDPRQSPLPTIEHYDGTPCKLVPCADCDDRDSCDCDINVCESCSKRVCHECSGTDPENGCHYCWPCSRKFLREVIAGLHDDELTMTPDEAKRELAALIERYGDD